MHYQSDGTQVPVRPTPAAVTGTPGYVAVGSAAAGIPPSDDDPDLMNTLMDEIANPVIASGQTLDKTKNNQLLLAMQIFGRGRELVFTANTVWICPPNAFEVRVTVIGGGGAGGAGGGNSGFSGAGGGGGGFAQGVFAVTLGTAYAITIGAGGIATIANGGNGGTTSFGAMLSATGGQGGCGVGAVNSAGGLGGMGMGGTVNAAGSCGIDGNATTNTVSSGSGGGSALAGAGRAGSGGGVSGQSLGAGGGGSYGPTVNAPGGGGISGVAIVEY